ncbi:MAG: periplasmic heavy metal sensor [Gammaproteobacteria bacterium]|nr:periplasmic heavy metal sensor [Gammaproteobacteria bacterium]
MMNRILPFVMAATLAVPFAVSAESDHHKEQGAGAHKEHGHSGSAHHFSDHWAKTLSDDQKARVDVMHLKLDRELGVLKAQVELMQKEINALAAQDNADMSAINKKIDELMGVKKQIMRARYAHILEMRAALTPAQRVSYDMDTLGLSGVK